MEMEVVATTDVEDADCAESLESVEKQHVDAVVVDSTDADTIHGPSTTTTAGPILPAVGTAVDGTEAADTGVVVAVATDATMESVDSIAEVAIEIIIRLSKSV